MRRFVGIDLGREPVPDETTLCKFRTCWSGTIWARRCSNACTSIWNNTA